MVYYGEKYRLKSATERACRAEFRKGTQCKVSTLLSLWSPRQISFPASKYDDAHSMLPTKEAQPSISVQRCCQGSMMWA